MDELLAKRGEWVSMPRLVDVSGSYNVHSRISDLRARGIDIENRTERVNGVTQSYYRIPEPLQATLF